MEDKALSTRVILVRHGESSYNVERRVQGHCDESTLTDAGRAAALKVGTALSGLTFDAVYSSPLRRAKETAQLALSCFAAANHYPPEIQFTDKLKEINLVLWEGMLFSDVEEKFPDDIRLWRDQPHKLRMEIPGPDGTVDFFPVPALYEQARQFWQEVLPRHGDQTILVVAHSGINRALISTAIGLDCDRYQALQQSNCGITVLNFAGGLDQAVQLESLNLTGHFGEPLPKRRSGQQGPRLLLVRHGETEWNRQKRFQGQIDVPLNDNGREQARQAAEFLRSVSIDVAVSSSMQRPKETAEIILQHHPGVELKLEDELQEISHGLWEGKLESEIEAEFPGELQRWQATPEAVQMPEGENLQQVWDRAIAAWYAIVETAAASDSPQTVMVVAHDAINKAILCHVVGLGPENFWNFKQGNGAVSVIDYPKGPAGQPVLQAMNITTHLAGGVLDQTAAGAL
ncbi:MAG TPA: histidine phosphatase family protein [Candidatus Obscuribacterales bacterium]